MQQPTTGQTATDQHALVCQILAQPATAVSVLDMKAVLDYGQSCGDPDTWSAAALYGTAAENALSSVGGILSRTDLLLFVSARGELFWRLRPMYTAFRDVDTNDVRTILSLQRGDWTEDQVRAVVHYGELVGFPDRGVARAIYASWLMWRETVTISASEMGEGPAAPDGSGIARTAQGFFDGTAEAVRAMKEVLR